MRFVSFFFVFILCVNCIKAQFVQPLNSNFIEIAFKGENIKTKTKNGEIFRTKQMLDTELLKLDTLKLNVDSLKIYSLYISVSGNGFDKEFKLSSNVLSKEFKKNIEVASTFSFHEIIVESVTSHLYKLNSYFIVKKIKK